MGGRSTGKGESNRTYSNKSKFLRKRNGGYTGLFSSDFARKLPFKRS